MGADLIGAESGRRAAARALRDGESIDLRQRLLLPWRES